MIQKEKELGKERNREEKKKERERIEYEKKREKEEKEILKEKYREKEKERQERENEKKKEKVNEKREEHLKAKEEIEREKEEKEKMKLRNREEKQKQREKEKEEKEKIKEKEKEERIKREEKNKKEREEKERQKQLEKEEKLKIKEEREKQRQKEREEKEKEKKREKEEKEKEKQKIREEKFKYNERFLNSSKLSRENNRKINLKSIIQPKFRDFRDSEKSKQQMINYQKKELNPIRLFRRKRKNSHKRIQPRNRIPRIDPKKTLGKTTLKIIKPKRYDEDESESEHGDFEEKLMKIPRFKAKYRNNNFFNKKNRILNINRYYSGSYGKKTIDYQRIRETENKMGGTKKTNVTISEVDEEEKNYKNKNLRKGALSQVKPKSRLNTNSNLSRKMREILGKQYKLLVNDPLNPYGTFWPSNFLKAGYDVGFEYDDFQSGVPVLKLRNLGKKQLPPIKKKGSNLNMDNNFISPIKNIGGKHLYPITTAKKNVREEFYDSKQSKTESNKISNKLNTEENQISKGTKEEKEIIFDN